MGTDWIDKQDVMQTMHVSDSTLRRWRRDKVIPYAKLGGKIYYRRTDIDKTLSNALKSD